MKVLLDTCVWGGATQEVRAAGHDVVWVGEWSEDPGDVEILTLAHQKQRVLVTLDKDFGELAILRQTPHHGILRLVNFSARQQAAACIDVLSRYGDELITGAIITAEPGRVRIRPAEISEELASDNELDVDDSQKSLPQAEILSVRNWQRVVVEAIATLPVDIQSSVGYSPPTTRMVIVTISVEPIGDEDQESRVCRVEVTWWESMRDKGWPREFDKIYGHGGLQEEQADWPIITVFGEFTRIEFGLFPGRTDIGSLQREVQLAIMEEMWGGGGISMIEKDDEGRFFRDDGSMILEWQAESNEDYHEQEE